MHYLEIYDFYNIPSKYLRLLNDKILFNYPFIKYLDASYNLKITNVNYMHKLIELDASGHYCGIDDLGIKNINLKKLKAYYNKKITNINHMYNLSELVILGDSGIGDLGINKLNLIKLDAGHNKKITNINYMTNLSELNASGNCGISD
jgi:hypothetical protein